MDITEFRRNHANNRHPWEKARAKIIKVLIQKYHATTSHILDVGSGDSFVLNYLCLNKMANKYTAIDTAYTKEIIESINNASSCKIEYLQKLPEVLATRANCVLLLDVLEHCENDNELLQQLNSTNLIQSAYFFVTVPAFQSLFSQHDKLLLHYRRYTIKMLGGLCKENHFEIVSSGYFFTSLLLIRCIQLFLEKLSLRKSKKSIDNWQGVFFVSKLIASFLWVDFLIGRFFLKLGIQLPGLSAYCICRPLPS